MTILQETDIGGVQLRESGAHPHQNQRKSRLLATGRPWADIREELILRKQGDYDWKAGRVPIYVYHDNDELLTVSRDAYSLYFSENALGKRAFPSVAEMEDEIISTSLSLFRAPDGATGSFTSGGTESIFIALKTARERFRAMRPGVPKPKVVVPRTAHPAFDKAAHYLDVDIVRTNVGSDLQCDINELSSAVDQRTMLIAGSAPCYPYGVFDPISKLGELAVDKELWLHVDACLGGFLAPFARSEGYPVPEFEFSIAGVTSLSADLHKYGFSAKGASVVLYRSESLQEFQRFDFRDWPRGSYSTDTFLGTRPAGAVASAWAVLQYLGTSGYRRLARTTMEAKQRLVRGIENIGGLQVVRPSELSIVLYRSIDARLDINAVAEELSARGWFVGRSRDPEGIHLALNAVHAPIVQQYLDDLGQAVQAVRDTGRIGDRDDRTY